MQVKLYLPTADSEAVFSLSRSALARIFGHLSHLVLLVRKLLDVVWSSFKFDDWLFACYQGFPELLDALLNWETSVCYQIESCLSKIIWKVQTLGWVITPEPKTRNGRANCRLCTGRFGVVCLVYSSSWFWWWVIVCTPFHGHHMTNITNVKSDKASNTTASGSSNSHLSRDKLQYARGPWKWVPSVLPPSRPPSCSLSESLPSNLHPAMVLTLL